MSAKKRKKKERDMAERNKRDIGTVMVLVSGGNLDEEILDQWGFDQNQDDSGHWWSGIFPERMQFPMLVKQLQDKGATDLSVTLEFGHVDPERTTLIFDIDQDTDDAVIERLGEVLEWMSARGYIVGLDFDEGRFQRLVYKDGNNVSSTNGEESTDE